MTTEFKRGFDRPFLSVQLRNYSSRKAASSNMTATPISGTRAAGSISTCRLKLANTRNFRGFPHVPGNDFTLRVASRRDKNDGKKLR